MMPFYELILGILCVWRISHLLNAEDGPWQVVVRLRWRAGDGFWGEVLDCFHCLSLWIALPLAVLLADTWRQGLLLWPALSAGAILIQHLVEPASPAPAARVIEEKEVPDELLRPKQTTTDPHGPSQRPAAGS